MLAKSLQKLSQSTAIAALGVAMLAAAGTAPASAAVTTFNLNVTLDSSATVQGTYKVDTDLLPTQSQVLLNDWNIDLKDSSGNLLKTYSKSAGANQIGGIFGQDFQLTLPGGTGGFVDALVFIDADIPNNNFSQLFLPFSAGFTGEGTPLAGSYLAQANPGIVASLVSGGSTAVPEPITLTGTAVAGVMGVWMKRKQKASKAA